MTPLVLELSDLSLNGARSTDRIEALSSVGRPDHVDKSARYFYELGIRVLPDVTDQWIAYLFLYVRSRPGPTRRFDPFPGDVVFHGKSVAFRDRKTVEDLFATNTEVYRLYENGDDYFRYILIGDEAERRIGFFYKSETLDHILLN